MLGTRNSKVLSTRDNWWTEQWTHLNEVNAQRPSKMNKKQWKCWVSCLSYSWSLGYHFPSPTFSVSRSFHNVSLSPCARMFSTCWLGSATCPQWSIRLFTTRSMRSFAWPFVAFSRATLRRSSASTHSSACRIATCSNSRPHSSRRAKCCL